MQIGSVILNVAPGPSGYTMTPQLFGTFERALDHSLVAKNVTIKKIWRLEFYALEQVDDLAAEAVSGADVTFTDYDGTEYTTRITDLGPVSGYPRADLGRMYVVVEEV
ncbi:MAG: hypothetical protein PHG29_08485 [Prolixibacteraceae bacterium]|nr:hypothetical protein [Prolixibacteraceae bacterium]